MCIFRMAFSKNPFFTVFLFASLSLWECVCVFLCVLFVWGFTCKALLPYQAIPTQCAYKGDSALNADGHWKVNRKTPYTRSHTLMPRYEIETMPFLLTKTFSFVLYLSHSFPAWFSHSWSLLLAFFPSMLVTRHTSVFAVSVWVLFFVSDFCFIWNHFCFLSCVLLLLLSFSSLFMHEIRYCEKKIWFRNISNWMRVETERELMHKQKLILLGCHMDRQVFIVQMWLCCVVCFSSVIFALKMIFWKVIFGANTHANTNNKMNVIEYILIICECMREFLSDQCIFLDLLLSTIECGPFLYTQKWRSTSFKR